MDDDFFEEAYENERSSDNFDDDEARFSSDGSIIEDRFSKDGFNFKARFSSDSSNADCDEERDYKDVESEDDPYRETDNENNGWFDDAAMEDNDAVESEVDYDRSTDEESEHEIAFQAGGGGATSKREVLKNGMLNRIDDFSSNSEDDADLSDFVVDDDDVVYDSDYGEFDSESETPEKVVRKKKVLYNCSDEEEISTKKNRRKRSKIRLESSSEDEMPEREISPKKKVRTKSKKQVNSSSDDEMSEKKTHKEKLSPKKKTRKKIKNQVNSSSEDEMSENICLKNNITISEKQLYSSSDDEMSEKINPKKSKQTKSKNQLNSSSENEMPEKVSPMKTIKTKSKKQLDSSSEDNISEKISPKKNIRTKSKKQLDSSSEDDISEKNSPKNDIKTKSKKQRSSSSEDEISEKIGTKKKIKTKSKKLGSSKDEMSGKNHPKKDKKAKSKKQFYSSSEDEIPENNITEEVSSKKNTRTKSKKQLDSSSENEMPKKNTPAKFDLSKENVHDETFNNINTKRKRKCVNSSSEDELDDENTKSTKKQCLEFNNNNNESVNCKETNHATANSRIKEQSNLDSNNVNPYHLNSNGINSSDVSPNKSNCNGPECSDSISPKNSNVKNNSPIHKDNSLFKEDINNLTFDLKTIKFPISLSNTHKKDNFVKILTTISKFIDTKSDCEAVIKKIPLDFRIGDDLTLIKDKYKLVEDLFIDYKYFNVIKALGEIFCHTTQKDTHLEAYGLIVALLIRNISRKVGVDLFTYLLGKSFSTELSRDKDHFRKLFSLCLLLLNLKIFSKEFLLLVFRMYLESCDHFKIENLTNLINEFKLKLETGKTCNISQDFFIGDISNNFKNDFDSAVKYQDFISKLIINEEEFFTDLNILFDHLKGKPVSVFNRLTTVDELHSINDFEIIPGKFYYFLADMTQYIYGETFLKCTNKLFSKRLNRVLNEIQDASLLQMMHELKCTFMCYDQVKIFFEIVLDGLISSDFTFDKYVFLVIEFSKHNNFHKSILKQVVWQKFNDISELCEPENEIFAEILFLVIKKRCFNLTALKKLDIVNDEPSQLFIYKVLFKLLYSPPKNNVMCNIFKLVSTSKKHKIFKRRLFKFMTENFSRKNLAKFQITRIHPTLSTVVKILK